MSDFAADLEAYRQRLDTAGLGGFADVLVAAARPGVRLIADPGAGTESLGSSRLGGVPDLPPGTPWPSKDGAPLSFVAQCDLAPLRPYDIDALLPADGLLSFFYDAATQSAWGFDPGDRDSFAVIYSSSAEPLGRRDAPPEVHRDGQFNPVGLTARTELTFVPWESYLIDTLGMTREQRFAYSESLPDDEGDQVIHRLLGHPDPVQGDMQVECQLASNGLYCGTPDDYRSPRAAQLRPGAIEWKLLLQLDSEDAAGMMWGDVGRIYYWIKNKDLAARNWDETWLVLQCG